MACETERPASSMSWSIEKAPVDISSSSSAAAALGPIVRSAIVVVLLTVDVAKGEVEVDVVPRLLTPSPVKVPRAENLHRVRPGVTLM